MLETDLLPGFGGPLETQTQGVVVVDQVLQGLFQALKIQSWSRLQHYRLVPVVRIAKPLFKKPALDRC